MAVYYISLILISFKISIHKRCYKQSGNNSHVQITAYNSILGCQIHLQSNEFLFLPINS